MYDHLNTKSRTGHKRDYINKYIWLSTKKKNSCNWPSEKYVNLSFDLQSDY